MITHPAQYSPEVIEVLRGLIKPGERIHDPFAGTGLRLAALCNELGAIFTGMDIETWPGRHVNVWHGDSRHWLGYPDRPFTVVTSPVYLNKRLADYANGPLPTTKVKGRRDYGIALGRALHPNNLARHTGRKSRAEAYWELHGECVEHWGDRVLLNVDMPIAVEWVHLLRSHGYEMWNNWAVYTKRYRGLANADKRAEFEVVIEARR